jgi:hypothetical protein
MNRVLKWNGRDLPDELRELPPGRYVVESVDVAPELTPEQEQDLSAAIDEADAGSGISLEDARARIEQTLKR